MSDVLRADVPSDVEILQQALPGARRGLQALAAAESLTDTLANELLALSEIEDSWSFLDAVHGCVFVVHRADEWRLTDAAKWYLRSQLARDPGLSQRLHQRLLRFSSEPGVAGPSGQQLPNYLREGPGRAFHSAELDPTEGLAAYSRLGLIDEPRVGWMGSQLAGEQQMRGILPPESSELDFLRGMVLYREGRQTEAVDLLRPVTDSQRASREVAVATHLVGRFDAMHAVGLEYRPAVEMMWRSRQLGAEIGDQVHLEHVSHSLALALLRHDPESRTQALELLESSAAIAEKIGDNLGLAKILASLGRTLSQSNEVLDLERAEAVLHRSLDIGTEFGYRFNPAPASAALRNVLQRRVGQAELWREAIEPPHLAALEIAAAPSAGSADTWLTDRELEVLGELQTKKRMGEIAADLKISPKTVRNHARRIYRKLGVSSRAEAVEEARRLGLR